MASAQQLAPAIAAATERPTRSKYVRYLLWAMLFPVLAWVLAFPLVCSRSYEQWGETQWGPVLEFPYEANTPDADVVVFGDSSAFLGIDPRLINQQLGVRSVVLPSTVGSLPVIGDAPLRTYLAHHPQPKLIVLYFSAWNLDFTHTAPGRLFEGEEMMFRHGTARETLRFMERHPTELLAFPLRLYSTFGAKMIFQLLHHESRARDTAASLGHAPYLEPYGPLNNLCRIPSTYLKQRGDATVAQLREKYARPGTAVMVYLAPVPGCVNSAAARGRSFPDLETQPPVIMPATDFAADPYYAHIRPPFVPAASAVFADALRRTLGQTAPESPH